MSLTLLDFQYTTSIEKLWSALTDSSKRQDTIFSFALSRPNGGMELLTAKCLSWTHQTGITNAQALNGAKYGWSNWCGELEKVLA